MSGAACSGRSSSSTGSRRGDAVHPSYVVSVAAVLARAATVTTLVGNAVEHHDGERPRVAVTLERDGDRVTLAESDNGLDIPREERQELERGSETPLHHSSGLGLWLVNWVVENCGGRVERGDDDPTGSVVRLELWSAE